MTGSTSGQNFTMEVFHNHVRSALITTMQNWNETKLEAFERYFGSTFQEYFSKFPLGAERSSERTKAVQPAFNNELNKILKLQCGEHFSNEEIAGSDISVLVGDEWVPIEQKLATSVGEQSIHKWTGNHVSSKESFHLLVRIKMNDTGNIIAAYCGILDMESCGETKWKRKGGNRAVLRLKWADEEHLIDILGNRFDHPDLYKKDGGLKAKRGIQFTHHEINQETSQ